MKTMTTQNDLRKVAEELGPVEAEQKRWQDAIMKIIDATAIRYNLGNIDGGGCDSGDPLDFTTSEIHQVINQLADKLTPQPTVSREELGKRLFKAMMVDDDPLDWSFLTEQRREFYRCAADHLFENNTTEQLSREIKGTCVWRYDGVNRFDSDCKTFIYFEPVVVAAFTFCPFCGGTISQNGEEKIG